MIRIHQGDLMKKFKSESGQGLTEYAIVLSLVAVAAIFATAMFGGVIKSKIASITSAIAGSKTSEVLGNEKKGKRAAQKASSNANDISNMSIDKDVFDTIQLGN